MKDEENRIVALDFGGYSFLPSSFFAFVLRHGDPSGFTQRIASRVVYPPSTELVATMNASCALVPFSSNDIGDQISLLSFLFPTSLPPARIPSSMCYTGLSEELKSRLQQTRRTSRPPFNRTASSLLATTCWRTVAN